MKDNVYKCQNNFENSLQIKKPLVACFAQSVSSQCQFETLFFASCQNTSNILSSEVSSHVDIPYNLQTKNVFESELSRLYFHRFSLFLLISHRTAAHLDRLDSSVVISICEKENAWIARKNLIEFSSKKYVYVDILPDLTVHRVDKSRQVFMGLSRWNEIVQHGHQMSHRPYLIFRFSLFDWLPLAKNSPKKAAFLFISSFINHPFPLSVVIDTMSTPTEKSLEEQIKEMNAYIIFIEELALIFKNTFFINSSHLPSKIRLPALFFSLRGMLFSHFSSHNVPFIDVQQISRFSSSVLSIKAGVWLFSKQYPIDIKACISPTQYPVVTLFLTKLVQQVLAALSIEQVGIYSIVENIIYEILCSKEYSSSVLSSHSLREVSSLLMSLIVSLWNLQASLARCRVNTLDIKDAQVSGTDSATLRSMLLQLEIFLHESIERRQILQRSNYCGVCTKQSSQGGLSQLLIDIDGFSLFVIQQAQALLRMNNSLLRQSFSLF